MRLLTTQKIQLLLDSAGTDVEYSAHYVDDSGTALSYGASSGASDGTTAVDIVAAPGSGTRVLRYLEIANKHNSASWGVTIRLDVSGTARCPRTYQLPAGAMIHYIENEGWSVTEANGAKRSPGLAGSNDSILFNDAGSVGGATNALIDGSELALAAIATPTAPSSGRVKLFGRSLAGRVLPAAIGPSGRNSSLQPFLGRNRIFEWKPPGNATTAPTVDGCAAPTATGTATARNVATTSLAANMRRLGYVSSAVAGNLAGPRLAAAQLCRGDGTVGGFMVVIRFVVSDAATVSGARMFVGLDDTTTAPTNVEPNTLTNIIGVCQLSTSSNLHLIYNDASGTATTTDLGANFPAGTASLDAYELILFSNSGSSEVGYYIERMNTGDVAEGTLTTDIPASTTLLGVQMWRCNNATALAVGIDLVSLYGETDF